MRYPFPSVLDASILIPALETVARLANSSIGGEDPEKWTDLYKAVGIIDRFIEGLRTNEISIS